MQDKIKLSMSDLVAEIRRRQKLIPFLKRKEAKLEAQLAALREEVAVLEGAAAATVTFMRQPVARVKRAQNRISLSKALLSVLSKDKPKSVKMIAEEVLKSGYKTNSRHFAVMVHQTLAREKKHIQRVGRGLYQLKG